MRKHFLAVCLGVLAFLFGWGVNYQVYQDQWKGLYGFALALLVAVLLFGQTLRGTKGWLMLPGFSVQVTEIARVCLVLVLAAYLDRAGKKIRELGTLLGALLVAGPVVALILKQPDFSSVLVIFPVVLLMLFVAGSDMAHLGVLLGYGFLVGSLPLLWTWLGLKPDWVEGGGLPAFLMGLSRFGWVSLATALGVGAALAGLGWLSQQARLGLPTGALVTAGLVILLGLFSAMMINREIKGYQRKRVEVYLSPELDPRGAGYNILQAQIAIGSGGMWGKGLFSGTQSKLGFLPERHTDFIFAVIGEEMGFLGTFAILALYLYVVWRAVSAARMARDGFGCIAAAGIAAYLGLSLIVNVGMSVGIFPVAGVPLPFVSYGGSNLVACLWMMGILASIYARRYAFV